MFQHVPVLIKGAGDLASGVALRLHRSGFPVLMTELEHPLTVRRSVAFAEAVFAGQTMVEEVCGRRCLPAEIKSAWAAGAIPVLVDPEAQVRAVAKPVVVVDAIMAKRNLGTRIHDARLVVALGPGFNAGQDCHVVIETNRGHNLGRAIHQGSAEPDTGQPGALPGVPPNLSRVLRAPQDGYVLAHYAIGDRVPSGAIIATVRSAEGRRPVVAPFAGVLRGLVHPTVYVHSGMKIGDLDPRARPAYCFTASDKSLAVGGGVLEAVLAFLRTALPPVNRPAPPPRRRRR
ncbi:MAG: EF2563 family selenium-dependent molybdenum hydroxylase system protein [Chloroflexi bacterium]|nr:MAG: EF2563 family selenium-dependent molybdenum hydroxylase system protein [Chloroflexota bacterium]